MGSVVIGRVVCGWDVFFFFREGYGFLECGGMCSRWFSLGWFICATLIFFAVRIRDSKASKEVSSKDESFLKPQMAIYV